MIKLRNTYSIGVLVMFYEIEMFKEYIDSCIQMTEGVENKENVHFHFCWNQSQYFENIDTDKITGTKLQKKFYKQMDRLKDAGIHNVHINEKHDTDDVYNIAGYRRDLNYNWCNKTDFVLWGETDSLWPKETLQSIESVSEYASGQGINRFILTFAYRKMWDDGWKPLEHVDMTDLPFIDTEEWNINAQESPKSYMTLETMNEINNRYDELDIRILKEPKFDGSLLVMSSGLLQNGVNIPHSCHGCGEDASFERMCKQIMGDSYIQIVVKNILKVHNRVHPKKREYVVGEKHFENVKQKRKSNKLWQNFHKMCEHNLYRIGPNQEKFFNVTKELEKIK